MLKLIIDSLEDVDEALRKFYNAFDDNGTERFMLKVVGVEAHPDTQALKNALERQKARVRELNTELGGVKDRLDDLPEDFDIDLYQRAVTEGVGGGKIKNEDEIRAEAAAAATKRAETAAAKDLSKVVEERDRLKTRVEDQVKREALDAALDTARVTDPALRKGARAILMSAIKVHEIDGDYEALAKDGELGDIPVAEHVKSWAATDEGKAFVAARETGGGGANGGGSGGNPADSSNANPWKAETFNVTKQAQLRKEDPATASRMMREAGLIN